MYYDGSKLRIMRNIKELTYKAIKDWNEIADERIGTRKHIIQIRAFIIGKGYGCTLDNIFDFITQDMLD